MLKELFQGYAFLVESIDGPEDGTKIYLVTDVLGEVFIQIIANKETTKRNLENGLMKAANILKQGIEQQRAKMNLNQLNQ